MRVLYLTEEPITFSGSMVRGGQIHVRNVVEGLRERGHDTHLIDWSSEPERQYQHSIAPRSRFVVDPARTFHRAISIGKKIDTDVIVSKTRKTYVPGVLAARRLGVPHVIHVGSSPGGPGNGLFDRIDRASVVARLKAPHDGYFVVCDALVDDLVQLGVDHGQVYNVKNAVDTERFHPERVPVELDEIYRRQLDALDDSIRLGFVGGLQPYKGLDDLASALDEVETACQVVIAGDGPERKRLERRFGEQTVFLGAVPYEQVPAIYHRLDVLVLPSHTEGLPRVVLEAQASGVPVIATRVGGIPEIIDQGETGILCSPQDSNCLAETIDRLANDSDMCGTLATAARSAVIESWSWDTLIKRYETGIRGVVRGSNCK